MKGLPLRSGTAEATVLEGLRTLIGRSRFVQKDVVKRLQECTGLSLADVRGGLGTLAKLRLVEGVTLSGDVLGRVFLAPELSTGSDLRPIPPAQRLWIELVEERCREGWFNDAQALVFKAAADSLPSLPEDEIAAVLDGLIQLLRERETLVGLDPALVSARYLQGSAKLLGAFGRMFSALGIAEDAFDGRARYVVAAGPADPCGVLLVENPASLEALVSLGLAERLLVLSTFGYGLTWSGIVRALGSSGALPLALLIRSGSPPDPQGLVGRIPFLHWGDLDHEGLRIFIALRMAIPDLQLSALYKPMAQAICNPRRSHPYTEYVGKGGQRPLSPLEAGGDQLLLALAALCHGRAVDQESVPEDQIAALADKALSLGDL